MNEFQTRILGLVSYYVGSTPEFFAKKNMYDEYVTMSDYHERIYDFFQKVEDKMMQRTGMRAYSTYTRQSCNFVFPAISNNVSGEQRPRPSEFKIHASDL